MGILVAHTGPAPAVEDANLIRAVVAGEPTATRQFVVRHWDDAFRVAFYLIQDQGVAEDVAQETILAALRSIADFELGRDPRPWIERIAANRALDQLRRRRRRPEVLVEEIPADNAADELAQELAREAIPHDLARALRKLDVDLRTAVVLRHLLDFEPAEIGARCGISAGAARARIFRGLSKLRELLMDPEGARS
jgi:RNA polymerase sigma-70 factor (ECF subfamily)